MEHPFMHRFLKTSPHFDLPIDLPSGNFATYAIEAADVNNDGFPDLVIGNRDAKNQILLNDKKGGFLEAVDLPGEVSFTYSIALADINGDNNIDIVVGNFDETPNQLLLNFGEGVFLESLDLPGHIDLTYKIALADVNSDGALDVIVGNRSIENQLLINRGGRDFDVRSLPGSTHMTFDLAVTDLNRDGHFDIITANRDVSFYFLINDGEGGFSDPKTIETGSSKLAQAIFVEDVNSDGFPDLLVANYGSSNQVYLNNKKRDGGFHEDEILLPNGYKGDDSPKQSISIHASDFNQDSAIDIVIGNHGYPNQLLINDGRGNFADAVDLTLSSEHKTQSICAIDLNLNGKVDIVFGNNPEANKILMNIGNYDEDATWAGVFVDVFVLICVVSVLFVAVTYRVHNRLRMPCEHLFQKKKKIHHGSGHSLDSNTFPRE